MWRDFMIADIHCHPNLKAFNSGCPIPVKSLWDGIVHHTAQNGITRLIRNRSNGIYKASQSNLYEMAEAGVRVVIISLYPIERGFLQLRNLPKWILGGPLVNDVIEHITGFSAQRIEDLRNRPNDYFSDLQEEYSFIMNGQGPSPDGKYAYQVVSNYTELQQVLVHRKNTLAVMFSIEGAHALGLGCPESDLMTEEELKSRITQNIRFIKQWECPPFFINLAHHFWNQLGGHSTSFKKPIGALINQQQGLDEGLTNIGRHTIRELLSTENGPRILIDTKHMSVSARKEYFQFIQSYNHLHPDQKIPVICSHTGVNGFKDLASSVVVKDKMSKSYSSLFHRWSINISDEEIRVIADSDGLIGIMMDKGMLGGVKHTQRISRIQDEVEKRNAFCHLFMANVFHIVEVLNDPLAWDIIALGTDYDGAIMHMDPYPSAIHLPTFRKELIQWLEITRFHEDRWYGYKPEELIQKILFQNTIDFIERHYHGTSAKRTTTQSASAGKGAEQRAVI